MPIAIMVHGGASTVPPEEAAAYQRGCLQALEAGWAILRAGGNACDAVEAAVRVLEADETFNAGRGSLLNADGEVEMCAAIMEGQELRVGVLGAVQGLRHPISVARQLLAVGPLALVGDGARRFAAGRDAELCDGDELITPKQREQWQQQEQQLRGAGQVKVVGCDTVGCVALDAQGLLAVGTSTGGEDHTPPGRIGDSAMPGCGFYADNARGACAVSGTGEAIMQVGVARSVIEHLNAGLDPSAAAERAIAELGARVQGEGGCIVLDREGRVGWAHNSPDMCCAYRTEAMEQPLVTTRKHTH